MLPVDCAVRRDCICRQGTCVVKDKTTTTTTTTTTKPTTTTTTPTTTTKTTTTSEAGECTNAKVVLILFFPINLFTRVPMSAFPS